MTFTSETARIAGSKGRKKGPSAKVQLWKSLEDKVVGKWSNNVNRHMETLWKKDPDQFMEHYKDLLNYFKPKQQAQTIQSRSEILIKVVNPPGTDGDAIDIMEEL